jgi:uncharacterized protein YjbJ (UPF0337 family)
MGIFDVFKTKVSEAAGKAGEVAEQAKDRVSDMVDKKKGGSAAPGDSAAPRPDAALGAEDGPSNMVAEGAPVADAGEAAPGEGDDAAKGVTGQSGRSGGGMTQNIKGNVASGVEKAAEKAKSATGNKYDDKIDSGVQKAKDRLR